MLLDLKPERGYYSDCLQHLLVTVAKWWKRDYDLLFIKSSNFNFTPFDPNKPDLIGKRIIAKRDNSYQYFEDFHGVKFTIVESTDSNSIFDYIINQLRMKRPVIIPLDAFWTPWNTYGYMRLHAPHYCLIIGVNRTEKRFYCLDPIYSMDILKLPFVDFYNGCKGKLGLFEKKEKKSIDVKLIIGQINESLKDIHTDSMVVLCNEIEESFDYKTELLEFPRASDAPINIKLVILAFGRHYLARGLEFLAHQTYSDGILKLAELVKISANSWVNLHNVMCKIYYSYQTKKAILKDSRDISDKIMEIRTQEELFKIRLEDYVKDNL